MLLFDFSHHNIEMACAMLDTCGRFLYRSADSHHRTKVYLVSTDVAHTDRDTYTTLACHKCHTHTTHTLVHILTHLRDLTTKSHMPTVGVVVFASTCVFTVTPHVTKFAEGWVNDLYVPQHWSDKRRPTLSAVFREFLMLLSWRARGPHASFFTHAQDLMMRKRAALHLDGRYNTMIENAFYYCNPPEVKGEVRRERPPMHQYIRKILYKDLSKITTEKVRTKAAAGVETASTTTVPIQHGNIETKAREKLLCTGG